jgi:uncharacterized protein
MMQQLELEEVEIMDEKIADLLTDDTAVSLETPVLKNKYRKLWLGLGITLVVLTLISLFASTAAFGVLTQKLSEENYIFYWMVLTGVCAEVVAGSMGMGYGVICTTVLLILNIPPVSISASIHSAETFTSAAGAFSHFKYGNINWKFAKSLAIPGAIGAIVGAIALIMLHHKSPSFIKPAMALYTFYLGVKILMNAFKNTTIEKKEVNIPVLCFAGGFIDSVGGGGWGPLVTGTFIKNGKTPRYVIGSSSFAKFVLTFASAFTFIVGGGFGQWKIVAGLLIGGVITAPLSAKLTTKLPVKKMFVAVGVVIIMCSLISFFRAVLK